MRRLAIVAGVGLALLALGVLGWMLPRLAQSDAVRARLQEAAEQATGEPVRWDTLSFGLLPPRLVIAGARVGPSSDPDVAVERVDLRLALLPLLARAVVIDSLEVRAPAVVLVRDAEGVRLRGAPRPRRARDEKSPGRVVAPTPAGERRLELAVRRLALEQGQVVVEDRTVDPPVTWTLNDLEARARGRSLEAPVDGTLRAELASGGSLRVSGQARRDGWMDLEARLDGVALEPAAVYLGPTAPILDGRLSGTLRWEGSADAPERVTARLALAESRVEQEDRELRGGLRLEAKLEGGFAAPVVSFALDASEAEIRAGELFQKPAALPATISGRAVRHADGSWAVGGLRLRLQDLDAQGSATLGRAVRLRLDAPAVDLARWVELVPPLASLAPAGRADLRKLDVTLDPLDLGGAIAFDSLRVTPEGRGPFVIDGIVEGQGAVIRASGLRVRVADQPLEADLEIDGLPAAPRLHATLRAAGVETNALLDALTTLRDTLYGPLTLSADASVRLSGAKSILEGIKGPMRLEIRSGRLVGVSLLRSAFSRLGNLVEAATLVGALRGQNLERYYGDEFESISGTFQVAGGFARTEDLRLTYRDYRADLRGAIGLVDQSLDLGGTLTIEKQVDAALAEAVGSAAPAGTPAPVAEPQVRVIPLAHVVGTLQRPQVDLSRQAVVSLARDYALGEQRTKIEQRIDEKLGPGAGKEILDALGGLLGGAPRESP